MPPLLRPVVLALFAAACLRAAESDRHSPQWLHLGPLTIDVSKEVQHRQVYDLDRAGATLTPPRENEALAFARNTPRETQAASLFGANDTWRLLRPTPPEKLVTWTYFTRYPVLYCNVLQTTLVSPRRDTTLELDITGGVRVYLNGERVYGADWPGGRYSRRIPHHVPLTLREGENNVIVLVFAQHLHVTHTFYGTVDPWVKSSVKWDEVDGQRAAIERDFQRIYLTPALLSPSESKLTAGLASAPTASARYMIEAQMPSGVRKLPLSVDAPVAVASFDDVSERLEVRTYAELGGGRRIEGPVYQVSRAGQKANVDPSWNYEQRRRYLLERFAESSSGVHRALARCALGTTEKITVEDIARSLDVMRARQDTADFAAHDLLRLYYQFPDRLQPETAAAIREAFLNFKYWVDEPGPSNMFMMSENHQILFNIAQYLTGVLFPKETFAELSAPGMIQSLKGRMLTTEWLDERQRHGFREWFSPGYLEKDVHALLNLVDCPNDDPRLGVRGTNTLHLLFLLIFSHEFEGFLHTTHGRVYPRHVLARETQDVAGLIWLLTGRGHPVLNSGTLALALSDYTVPPQILALAHPERRLLTRTQQGRMNRDGGANTLTLRAKDYVLSTLIDFRPGGRGYQEQTINATLPGGVSVWINSAISTADSWPGFVIGSIERPRALQVDNLAIAIFRLKDHAAFNHARFPFAQFDRWLEKDGWYIGQKGNGLVAVRSQHPVERTLTGQQRDAELLSRAPKNIWLVTTASVQEHGSLEAFAAALPAPEFGDGTVRVRNIQASWDGPLLVDGRAVATSHFPLVENEVVRGGYGEGRVLLTSDAGDLLLAP